MICQVSVIKFGITLTIFKRDGMSALSFSDLYVPSGITIEIAMPSRTLIVVKFDVIKIQQIVRNAKTRNNRMKFIMITD